MFAFSQANIICYVFLSIPTNRTRSFCFEFHMSRAIEYWSEEGSYIYVFSCSQPKISSEDEINVNQWTQKLMLNVKCCHIIACN